MTDSARCLRIRMLLMEARDEAAQLTEDRSRQPRLITHQINRAMFEVTFYENSTEKQIKDDAKRGTE